MHGTFSIVAALAVHALAPANARLVPETRRARVGTHVASAFAVGQIQLHHFTSRHRHRRTEMQMADFHRAPGRLLLLEPPGFPSVSHSQHFNTAHTQLCHSLGMPLACSKPHSQPTGGCSGTSASSSTLDPSYRALLFPGIDEPGIGEELRHRRTLANFARQTSLHKPPCSV